MHQSLYTSLQAPVITEKAEKLTQVGKYSIFVAPDATKLHIKNVMKRLYGVDVVSVNKVMTQAKYKWGKNRTPVQKRQARVKAIITIKKGQTLDLNNIK